MSHGFFWRVLKELKVGLIALIWIVGADYSHNLLRILAEEEWRIVVSNINKLFGTALLLIPRDDVQEDSPQHWEVVSNGN